MSNLKLEKMDIEGEAHVLAHRMKISKILPWDRNSHLTHTHAILPRLSREVSVCWLYWNSRTWSSSDVIDMFK